MVSAFLSGSYVTDVDLSVFYAINLELSVINHYKKQLDDHSW